MLTDDTLEHAAELLRVLGHPLRLGVLLELAEAGERCVHELVDIFGVDQPLLSQHLRVMRAADLVNGRRHGKEIRYAVADDHVVRVVRDVVSHAEESFR